MELIIAIIISAIAGSFLAWIFLNTRVAGKVVSLELLLEQEKQLHQEVKGRVAFAEQQKSQAEKESIALQTRLENEHRNFTELRESNLRTLEGLTAELREGRNLMTRLSAENEKLKAEQEGSLRRIEEQRQFLEDANKSLKDAFGALSADALQRNNKSFVELAQAKLAEKVTEANGELAKKEQAINSLVQPLSESLSKIDQKINDLEVKREGAYTNISTLLDQMKLSTNSLDKETRSLVTALKSSTSRGRYGEIGLRRLVEFSGMLEHCDFEEQVTTESESGKLRPDMIIHLPESRKVVVDSKVPLAAYLELFETEDPETQKQLMNKHVMAIKTHLKQLSSKAYWDQFEESPDFVVMFMQIESSYGAALQAWPAMIEEALNNRIIIATPTTLISILKSIGYTWNQISTMENIEEIRNAAVELYERSATLMEHLSSVGKSLTSTVNNYNKTVGSLEGAFLPQGRKINALAHAYTRKELPVITPLEVATRPILAMAPVQSVSDEVEEQQLN